MKKGIFVLNDLEIREYFDPNSKSAQVICQFVRGKDSYSLVSIDDRLTNHSGEQADLMKLIHYGFTVLNAGLALEQDY